MRWLIYWIGWIILRVTAWVLFGLKVIGTENIPRQGGFIFAVNHQSYVDPPLIGSAVPRVLHFFAKKELFENFLFKVLISYFNAIPVRRGIYDPESISRALGALKEGGGLMFFPEGTRGDGIDLLPPKPGIGMIAKRAGVPIIPAFTRGTSQLKRALLARKRVTVIVGEPVWPEEFAAFGDDKQGYLELAVKVMVRIRELKNSLESVKDGKAKVS